MGGGRTNLKVLSSRPYLTLPLTVWLPPVTYPTPHLTLPYSTGAGACTERDHTGGRGRGGGRGGSQASAAAAQPARERAGGRGRSDCGQGADPAGSTEQGRWSPWVGAFHAVLGLGRMRNGRAVVLGNGPLLVTGSRIPKSVGVKVATAVKHAHSLQPSEAVALGQLGACRVQPALSTPPTPTPRRWWGCAPSSTWMLAATS